MSSAKRGEGFLEDLEGLRAIAVLAVLIFHVNENLLPGGFLGVDLFFVISGYVVSKVLFERGIKGQLKDFYLNRFHRLIPASTVTILATIILFELFANQLTGSNFYISALSATFSFANINFFLISDYWSDELSINPFLHFWSLSVEEQFYLIWPGILYLAAIKKPHYAIRVLAALFFASVLLLCFIDTIGPSASFYLMPSRIFQFSAGALAFYLSNKKNRIHIREISFITGILLFFAFNFFISGHNVTILKSMIAPTIASFCILVGLQTKVSYFTLSNPLFRYIGRISYSLYLVHWPIIILLKINYGATFIIQALAIFLSFVSAYLLHEAIEKKCRLHKITGRDGQSYWPQKQSLINFGLFFSLVVAIIFGIYVSLNNKPFKNENSKPSETIVSEMKDSQKSEYVTSVHGINARRINTTYQEYAGTLWAERNRLLGGYCTLRPNKPRSHFNWELCAGENSSERILIIGDSVTIEMKNLFGQIFKKENMMTIGAAGCSPIHPEPGGSNRGEGCQELNRERLDLIFREDVSAIVIASNWKNWEADSIKSTFKHLASSGKPIVVIGARPAFTPRVPIILDTKNGGLSSYNLNDYLGFDPKEVDEKLKNSLIEYSNQVFFISIFDYLCPNNVCKAFTDNNALIYLDHIHISADASISIGKKILSDFGYDLEKHTGISIKDESKN